MRKQPKYVAFSTQKGGVGKSTFTVIVASMLHYMKGYNVAVIDCDFPQHSIKGLRKRDIDQVVNNDYFNKLAFEQFAALNKKSYPIVDSSPEQAIATANGLVESDNMEFDVIFFDLPGTVNSRGVIDSLSAMDYVFVPIIADQLVLESGLRFANILSDNIVVKHGNRLKELYLFWNMVNGREKTELYDVYETVIRELGLSLMQTLIPNSVRYKKEVSNDRKNVFRSTLFPPDKTLLKGSNLEELVEEICQIIKL
ncbi:MAG: ParA family protein [Mariniphaga sp.]|nr:ParA family protein [Mariniphaga sp.]